MTGFAAFHEELRGVAREVLGRTDPLSRGGDPGIPDWGVLARSGWLGLEVPERLGGAGATFAETAVVLREMGRAASRSGFFGSVVLGVGALLLLEPGHRRDSLLRSVAAGDCRLAVALPAWEELTESPWRSFRLERKDGRGLVHGQADFVLDGGGADWLIVFAEEPGGGVAGGGVAGGGVAVALLEAGSPRLDAAPKLVTDASRDFATVTADGVEVDAGRIGLLAGHPRGGVTSLLDRAALAVACDSLGLAETMLEATVSYTADRRQFGRPVGSFQAVKHACADMHVQIRVAHELVEEAVAALVEGGASASLAVSKAKSFACSAAVEVAGQAMQLHGGIGYTWERGIHAYLKRAAINRSMFGSASAHRRRLYASYGISMESE